jgi:hypothetical protein
VAAEVARAARLLAAVEIGGGADDGEALRRPDGDRHHVALDTLAQADAGIEAGGHDVDQTVVGDDLQLHLRVGSEETGHDGRQQQLGGRPRHVEPERAGRGVAEGVHVLDGVGDVEQRWPQAGEQPLAGFGGRDAAGGAVEKANAKPFLDAADGVTESRGRDPQLNGGAPEAAVGRD